MTIAENYLDCLQKAYKRSGHSEQWRHFEQIRQGASAEDFKDLQARFPDVPPSLLALLEYADGTYFKEYAGEKVCLYFLGSDLDDYHYPYYLLSAREMAESHKVSAYYADYINRVFDPEDVLIDAQIIDRADELDWLHFSDCMNNGGTSQLFIDFSPSAQGTKGQIVCTLHDPDEIYVLAASFDDYLQMLIDQQCAFVEEEE